MKASTSRSVNPFDGVDEVAPHGGLKMLAATDYGVAAPGLNQGPLALGEAVLKHAGNSSSLMWVRAFVGPCPVCLRVI